MPCLSVPVAQRFVSASGRRGDGFFSVAGEACVAFVACKKAFTATAVFHDQWGLMELALDSGGVPLLKAERLVDDERR